MGRRLFICILALCGATSTAVAGQVYSPPPPPRPVYIPPPPPPPRPQPVYQAPQPQPMHQVPQPVVNNPNACRNAGGQVVPCQAPAPPVQVRQPTTGQMPGVQTQPAGQRPIAGPAAAPNLNQASRVSLPNGAMAGTTPQVAPGQIPPPTPGRLQLTPSTPNPTPVQSVNTNKPIVPRAAVSPTAAPSSTTNGAQLSTSNSATGNAVGTRSVPKTTLSAPASGTGTSSQGKPVVGVVTAAPKAPSQTATATKSTSTAISPSAAQGSPTKTPVAAVSMSSPQPNKPTSKPNSCVLGSAPNMCPDISQYPGKGTPVPPSVNVQGSTNLSGGQSIKNGVLAAAQNTIAQDPKGKVVVSDVYHGGHFYPSGINPALQNECVSLVGALRPDIGSDTSKWKQGAPVVQPKEGGGWIPDPALKPGTPIATFKNESYPNTGTMDGSAACTVANEKGCSHAAIFEGYTYDTKGNINGMKILGQSDFKDAAITTKNFPTSYPYSVVDNFSAYTKK